MWHQWSLCMPWLKLDWPHWTLSCLVLIVMTGLNLLAWLLSATSCNYLHSSQYKHHRVDGKHKHPCYCLNAAAPASSSNGEFGEWNAFPGGQMPTSAQTVDNSGIDLFAAMTAGPATGPVSSPGSGPASADLFDLMGPTQSLTSSQSLNFSMSSTQSMSSTVLPQSRSQVCMIALTYTRICFLIIYWYTYHYKTREGGA